MNHEETKQQILNGIKRTEISGQWYEMTEPIDAESITEALRKHKNVTIPYIEKDIIIDAPIIMPSDSHLKVDKRQRIVQSAASEMCLLRNENVQNGAYSVTDPQKRDKNISIEGGIWNIKTGQRCFTTPEKDMQGSLGAIILCSVEQVSLKNMRIFDTLEHGRGVGAASYGIQLCDCRDFVVENIDFYDNSRDGVHINGPAEYGHVKHIRGEKMGDDMVALNAWDWDTSALTFGTISNLVVEDVEGPGNELRLLPGQKLYPNDKKVDCDLRNIVLENIRGMYTFKLYAQPNIANAFIPGKHDVSGTVGTIENVSFKDIYFKKLSTAGFCGIPVKGLFEICSDCNNIFFSDIYVADTFEEYTDHDISLVKVGPLSAVWYNNSDNPEDWGEVFDPDAICHADNLFFHNIKFSETVADDVSKLTKEVALTVNESYPKTLPKGGTGYGTIGKVQLV